MSSRSESASAATIPGRRQNIRPGTRADIQGLRAIAVLMVVAFHAGLPVTGGFVGVDVFFVISGFVITQMLSREWAANGRIAFGRFYRRRFTRLVPALALMVTVTMVMTALVVSPLGPQENAARTAWGAMLISANIVIANTTGGYFSLAAETNPLLHTWSLSVEEQFYLVFPVLLVLGWLVGRRMRVSFAPALIVSMLAIVSFGLAVLDEQGLSFAGSKDLFGFYSPATRAWEFAAGALVALVLGRAPSLPRRVAGAVGIVGALGLAASMFLIDPDTPFPGVWTLLPVLSTVLVVLSGTFESGTLVGRVLSLPAMVRIGDWSYSIYLWHWPLIVVAATLWPDDGWVTALAAGLSLLPAIVSYVFVEQPIRTAGLRGRRLLALIGLTLAPPLLLATLVLQANANAYWSPAVQAYHEASRPHASAACQDLDFIAEPVTTECVWGERSPGDPIYLIGDSHAAQLSDAVVAAGRALDRPVASVIAPACKLSAPYVGTVGQEPVRHCIEYRHLTLQWLESAEPGVVIIATIARTYWSPDVQLGVTRASMTSDASAKLAILEEGLTETVQTLKEAGHEVVLVHDNPTFEGPYPYQPSECSMPALIGGACDQTMPKSYADDQQSGVRAVIDRIAKAKGTGLVDLPQLICSADGCSSRNGEAVLYSDGNHLTVAASEMAAEAVADAVIASRR